MRPLCRTKRSRCANRPLSRAQIGLVHQREHGEHRLARSSTVRCCGTAAGGWQPGCSRSQGRKTCHYYWQVGTLFGYCQLCNRWQQQAVLLLLVIGRLLSAKHSPCGMRSRSHIVQSIRRNNRLRPRCYQATVSRRNGYRRQIVQRPWSRQMHKRKQAGIFERNAPYSH